MSFSGMAAAERNALISAVVVVITALISLGWSWGALMIVTLLAGAGALFVLYQPRMAPAMALPGSKGSLVAALGIAATVATALTALYWLGYITAYLASLDTLIFLAGLIASVVLAWSGWQILKSEGGKFRFGTPAATPPGQMPPAEMAAPETPPKEPAPPSTPA